MNRDDNQKHDDIGDDVRSAFDDMFDEAGIDAAAPPLDVRVATPATPATASRLPVTRAAAAVAVMAVGVLVAVAVRSGRDGVPLSGPSISAVDSSLDSVLTTPGSTSPGSTSPRHTAATTPEVAAEPRKPPTTAFVTVDLPDQRAGMRLPTALLMYDIATGEVVNRIDPWTEPDDAEGGVIVWGPPTVVSGERAYFWRQVLADCRGQYGKVLTTPWPVADGVVETETLADFGGWVFGLNPAGDTMFYGVQADCIDGAADGPVRFSAHLPALAVRPVSNGPTPVLGDEVVVTTRTVPYGDHPNSGIVDAVMTPSGELVVVLGPSGDVYRLQPTDGAVVEDDGVFIANIADLDAPFIGLPKLLAADDSTITVGVGPYGADDFTVQRGPNVDGGWTELVHVVGEGSVADDGYGNLVVVASPDATVTAPPDQPIAILRFTEGQDPVVDW